MTELEAAKERHSVRNYKEQPITKEIIEQLNQMIAECNRIGHLNFQFVEDAGNTFNRLLNKAMGLSSAPSVIACIGAEDETLEERVGYYGEKIVLYAQQLGLNTCWAGTYNKKNVAAKVEEGERLVIVIAIGYGVDSGRPHKSKTKDQVTAGKKERPEWFHAGVEMALLAPTAVNQQKFMIRLLEDDSVEIEDRGGILSKVDKGIVEYHFDLGAGWKEKSVMKI